MIELSSYQRTAEIIRNAKHVAAFTGAGISVESGISPFRGEGGLWNTYDPELVEINFFRKNPKKSWEFIKDVFFEAVGKTNPNAAHKALAVLEKHGLLQTVITQNIDNLHRKAGNTNVYEFHGNIGFLICLSCSKKYHITDVDLNILPPECKICGGLLKPDVVFFGEPIPEPANSLSFREAEIADVFIVIGSTGEVMPACMIPYIAKQNGASLIEVNIEESSYTHQIIDVFLKGKATEEMTKLLAALNIHNEIE